MAADALHTDLLVEESEAGEVDTHLLPGIEVVASGDGTAGPLGRADAVDLSEAARAWADALVRRSARGRVDVVGAAVGAELA